MPRKYTMHHGPGNTWMVSNLPASLFQSETVQAYDARDVDPLLAAVKETLCDDVPCARCDHLRAALKPFEAEEGSGG